ncbi:hypothetical protein HOY82DRAFT_240924 [Tuber indicum]|nr:hypothetical protein HOY82DRAFT_240924 [Tuber indicum]
MPFFFIFYVLQSVSLALRWQREIFSDFFLPFTYDPLSTGLSNFPSVLDVMIPTARPPPPNSLHLSNHHSPKSLPPHPSGFRFKESVHGPPSGGLCSKRHLPLFLS